MFYLFLENQGRKVVLRVPFGLFVLTIIYFLVLENRERRTFRVPYDREPIAREIIILY